MTARDLTEAELYVCSAQMWEKLKRQLPPAEEGVDRLAGIPVHVEPTERGAWSFALTATLVGKRVCFLREEHE